MKDRLKDLRKNLNLTQQELADSLGVSRSTYSQYETGRATPSSAVITLLCRTYSVSEKWLRSGEGEMFVTTSEAESLMEYAKSLGIDDTYRKRVVTAVLNMTEEDAAHFLAFCEKISKDKGSGTS